MAEGNSNIVSKPGTKSVVWEYFGVWSKNGKVIDNGIAVCRSCRRNVVAKHGNTSNLLSHLRTNHCKLYSEVTEAMKRGKGSQKQIRAEKEPTQASLEQVREIADSYEKTGKRWKELTESVTYFLAKDSQAMYTVEKPGFKKMLKTFDAKYKPPGRKYFSETAIPSLYSSLREQLVTELSSVKHFSATTDLWSSIGLRPYLSYTVHYIDSTWTLKSKCLQTHYMPEDHTAGNLAEALTTTLESWNLQPHSQVCITTDNGSNIVKATHDLQWARISCFGHNLHLAITKALDKDNRCSRALSISRKIVSSFHTSWKRRRELSKALLNMNIKDKSLVSVSVKLLIVQLCRIIVMSINILIIITLV